MDRLADILPPEIGADLALGLVALSGITAALTAALGIGGGLVLVSALAVVLPAEAVVPVHAVVQLGSNAGRSALLLRSVDPSSLRAFLPGAVLGVALGGLVAVELPAAALRAAVGAFVLVSTWGRPRLPGGAGAATFVGGVVSSVLTMFVGATGPFVVSLFRVRDLAPAALVATTAAAMTAQHGFKVAAFGLLGFPIGPWVPLLAAMVATGLVGTLLGTRVLRALPESVFRRVLKVVLTLLGLHLLVAGLVEGLEGVELGSGRAEPPR